MTGQRTVGGSRRPLHVVEAGDPRLADYRNLRDVTLRRSLEADRGLYVAEGEKVVRRAVAAGHVPRSFLMAPRWLDSLADVLEQCPDVPCYLAPEPLVEAVSGFHVHRGALASMERPAPLTVSWVLAGASRVLVLEDVNDHANVGAIFRNAAAFGFDAVVLSPRCADPLYRRTIKVSMGAVFAVPYARVEDWAGGPALLREHGLRVVALTPAADALDLETALVEARGARGLALMLGSEGHGLSPRWQREADVRARIPIDAGTDSLNVAAAAAVACYAARTLD